MNFTAQLLVREQCKGIVQKVSERLNNWTCFQKRTKSHLNSSFLVNFLQFNPKAQCPVLGSCVCCPSSDKQEHAYLLGKIRIGQAGWQDVPGELDRRGQFEERNVIVKSVRAVQLVG